MSALGDDPCARAVAFILRDDIEGGWSPPHDGDPNPTRYGITLATAILHFKQGRVDFDADHDGDVDVTDIKLMRKCTAEQFYPVVWKHARCPAIAAIGELTAIVHFDSCVQHGRFAYLFQEAIGCEPAGLPVDGKIGERTLDLFQHLVKHHGDGAMATALIRRRIRYYKSLANYPQNKVGWRHRINALCKEVGVPLAWSDPA